MAIKRIIKTPLTNTYHTIEKLREDYENEMFKFNDERLLKFNEYYNKMDPFERDILVLYSEYNSYRSVAEETYCSYGTIKLIMSVIRQDIAKLNQNQ